MVIACIIPFPCRFPENIRHDQPDLFPGFFHIPNDLPKHLIFPDFRERCTIRIDPLNHSGSCQHADLLQRPGRSGKSMMRRHGIYHRIRHNSGDSFPDILRIRFLSSVPLCYFALQLVQRLSSDLIELLHGNERVSCDLDLKFFEFKRGISRLF